MSEVATCYLKLPSIKDAKEKSIKGEICYDFKIC